MPDIDDLLDGAAPWQDDPRVPIVNKQALHTDRVVSAVRLVNTAVDDAAAAVEGLEGVTALQPVTWKIGDDETSDVVGAGELAKIQIPTGGVFPQKSTVVVEALVEITGQNGTDTSAIQVRCGLSGTPNTVVGLAAAARDRAVGSLVYLRGVLSAPEAGLPGYGIAQGEDASGERTYVKASGVRLHFDWVNNPAIDVQLDIAYGSGHADNKARVRLFSVTVHPFQAPFVPAS